MEIKLIKFIFLKIYIDKKNLLTFIRKQLEYRNTKAQKKLKNRTKLNNKSKKNLEKKNISMV
jgi:hypothetical protein